MAKRDRRNAPERGLDADTNAPTHANPLGILLRSVSAVPAMKYALAVAGVVSVVAIVAAFRISYVVAVVGALLVVGLMFVIVSFSRFAGQSARRSAPLTALVAWAFSVLLVVLAVLFTTTVFFQWPASLNDIASRLARLSTGQRWKIKVYELKEYGDNCERHRIGRNLAAAVLDSLTESQLGASMGEGESPISIVAHRGGSTEDSLENQQVVAELAPVIIVFGSVSDSSDDQHYEFSIRATAVGEDLDPRPIFQRYGVGTRANMRSDAHVLANEILAASRRQAVGRVNSNRSYASRYPVA